MATKKAKKTRKAASKPRLDDWGYPILTEAKVRRIAESLVPQNLRPYYIGIDILKQDVFCPYSAWNTDICLYFKAPVVSTAVDGSRYAHSDLEHMERELADCIEIQEDSKGDEEYAEYDEDADAKEIVAIRDAKPILDGWKPAKKGGKA